MCGIAGFWALNASIGSPEKILRSMGDTILHRGPDEQGVMWNDEFGVGFVHQRLAIQDLSSAGAQPMVSPSGRFTIIFNGEIYNYCRIAEELKLAGYCFRGHSDTEVMLAAFELWGIQESLRKFIGMFSFALLDRTERRLWLVRDRMGEKPLYYGWHNGVLLFASELKAFRVYPGFCPKIDRNALALMMRHGYIPAPHTIYTSVNKLPPSHYLCYDLSQSGERRQPQMFWSLENKLRGGMDWDEVTAADELERLLLNVVKEQMISDVPLGAFLSGGIDSSLVVSLMQKQALKPVRTFSIGFDVPGFNEAEHAAEVARHLGTSHTEMYVSPQDVLDVIPQLPVLYDEPFADSSQIPTYLVCRMARSQVTVALSGDGGDEVFAGYTHYRNTLQAWNRQHGGICLKARLSRLLLGLPPAIVETLVRIFFPGHRKLSHEGLREKLLTELMCSTAPDLQSFYALRLSFWARPEKLIKQSVLPSYALSQKIPEAVSKMSGLKILQWLDLNCYLPDDILTKVDRASMAVSLETRIPFLDHRVVSFALSLPDYLVADERIGKKILKKVLHRYVPQEFVNRPKQGFAIPINKWLSCELRDWAESLLVEKNMHEDGFWEVGQIRRIWEDHLAGRADYSFHLWGVLMFQAWLNENR
jgi:asparagine synthase (glutamine-hydrolysing)